MDDDIDSTTVTRDGIFDNLCLGIDGVFYVTYTRQPSNVLQFLDDFIEVYGPNYVGDLRPTAFNVGGAAYVANFPADVQPPGIVPELDSSTHPIGEGGSLPCISFEFDAAPDDARGCNTYSYVLTTDPGGEDPGEVPHPVRPTDGCKLRGTALAFDIGTYYISIRAQDNAGRWSSDYVTFGPFEVLDCNNTGQLDACDISCSFNGIPGVCDFGLSPCNNLEECTETSTDCNGNFKPDECDIASLESEDCDVNFVPDECQEIKHWTGAVGNPGETEWGLEGNWEELSIPVNGDSVCIPEGVGIVGVVYRQDYTNLTSLASHRNFSLIPTSNTNIWPDLELDENSFVLKGFQMGFGSTLTVHDRFFVQESFNWHYGDIKGNGETEVNDGLNLTQGSVGLGGVINNDGIIVKSTGSESSSMLDTINRGTFDIQSGSVQFHTSYNEYRQTAGETVLIDASLIFFQQYSPFYLEGGSLKGNGVVDGDVDNSGGLVSPGFSFGALSVSGDYTQGENGVLDIEIGGTSPSEFDVLSVTGTATLAGELRVTDIDDFVPAIGDTFVILTAADVSGTFGVENLASHYEVVYGDTTVPFRWRCRRPISTATVLSTCSISASSRIASRDRGWDRHLIASMASTLTSTLTAMSTWTISQPSTRPSGTDDQAALTAPSTSWMSRHLNCCLLAVLPVRVRDPLALVRHAPVRIKSAQARNAHRRPPALIASTCLAKSCEVS
ncbi:MAG: hypothetical protein ACYTHJ_00620 [Planctomycetota bacterium]|jgi:hypothetical protein